MKEVWIEMGGDAEGIYRLVDEIYEAIKAKLKRMTNEY